MTTNPNTRRRWPAVAAITVGALALVAAAVTVSAVSSVSTVDSGGSSAAPSDAAVVAVAGSAGGDLGRSVQLLRDRLRTNPSDADAWARLGSVHVEPARVTADPSYYAKAQEALERSLLLAPDGNGAAMIGMGALANARHDFAAAKNWAVRAQAVLPDTAAVYGVLADALTQLGEADAATAAVQRMLDLRPSVASFARASYDLELRGRVDEARAAMERALRDATSASEVAFTRYHLGELAFDNGRIDEASLHYELGLAAAPGDPPLRQGLAKVAAARGDLPAALSAYGDLVATVPLPQYVREHAALLTAAGRTTDVAAQFDLLARQQELADAAGATDDLTAAEIAADRGDAATSLRHAEAEWGRRRHVLVADAMAWALHLSGRDADALPFADAALALGTVDADFAYHRGMILRGLGRAAEAADQLATALRINPHFSPGHAPLAERAIAELRSGR